MATGRPPSIVADSPRPPSSSAVPAVSGTTVSGPPAPVTGAVDPAILEAVRLAVQQEVRAQLPASSPPTGAGGGAGTSVTAAGTTGRPAPTTTGELNITILLQ